MYCVCIHNTIEKKGGIALKENGWANVAWTTLFLYREKLGQL